MGILFLEDREEDWEKGHILALLEEFRRRVLKSCPETALEFGYSLDAASLGHIRQSIEKCQKALNMGENDLSKPFCMGVFSAWCTCMAGYSGRRAYSYALGLQCAPER